MGSIFWNDGAASGADSYAWSRAHKNHRLIYFGRCRSGRRWFWAAVGVREEGAERHGWADTEDAAVATARQAVEEIAAGAAALADFRAGFASNKLKELNAARRAARPAKAKGSAFVEYLYSFDNHLFRFPIVRKTAMRVFYLRQGEWSFDHGKHWGKAPPAEGVGYVKRDELEKEGEVYNRSRRWTSSDFHLYTSLERVMEAYAKSTKKLTETVDLAALKQEMADAHPDRGGTNEAFIAARKRYVAARRRALDGQKRATAAVSS